MDWTFYEPQFLYDREFFDIQQFSAWLGHRRFAYDLIRFMQPDLVVELGTHWGISFFSMCQAARDGQLNTRCYAVDSWLGDKHTGNYQEDVYAKVSSIAASYYAPHAILVRSSFDEALARLENNSVNVLHIDGYHTYEAVKHDFQAWQPKLAANSLVLFHDIAVRTGDFGVYNLWEELRHYPQLEFHHAYGLGVLFPKGVPVPFLPLLQMVNRLQEIYANKAY